MGMTCTDHFILFQSINQSQNGGIWGKVDFISREYKYMLNQQFSVDYIVITQLPSRVEHLRHKATIGHCKVIAHAVFSCRDAENLLKATKTARYPFVSPLHALLPLEGAQYKTILQRLNARTDDLHNLTHLGSCHRVRRQQRVLRTCLIQVMHNGHRIAERVSILSGAL